MIKAIPYERIEQKNEIEKELFSKFTPQEKRAVKRSWMKLLALIRSSKLENETHFPLS